MTLTVTRVTHAVRCWISLASGCSPIGGSSERGGPATSYELAQAGAANLRHHAQRGAWTARRARRIPAPPNLTDARCRALFASTLQRSDAPGAGVVAEAIRVTVRHLGAGGCTSRMAQEFGDHPEVAAERMRWVRALLS